MSRQKTKDGTPDTSGRTPDARCWVAYYRVSTQRQGRSGLGLDAQQTAVEDYIARHGGELIESFTEVESGRKMRNRPELQRALDLAKKRRATLIIAKLDRLARNLHTVTSLMESRTDFVCVDNPHATRLTIQILSAVAEDESRRTSVRTSEALRQAKARGVKIGETGKLLAAGFKAEALRDAEKYAGALREAQDAGISKVRDVRDWFNSRNIPSPGQGRWHLPNTHRMMKRVGILHAQGNVVGGLAQMKGRSM